MFHTQVCRHALLVIDVQQSFVHQTFWSEVGLAEYRAHQCALIEAAQHAEVEVIGILHANPNSDAAEFRPDSPHVRWMDWLPAMPCVFRKSVHNAFTDSGLLAYVQERGITDLTISGIRTEQCCETTARVAADLGLNVYFVTQATLTFAMTHADGTVYSADDIQKRTELVLEGRFATVATVEQMAQLWRAKA